MHGQATILHGEGLISGEHASPFAPGAAIDQFPAGGQDTDVNGQSLGDRPQHVYTVRFTARELWGDRVSERDAVYVDLWEDYLEPA